MTEVHSDGLEIARIANRNGYADVAVSSILANESVVQFRNRLLLAGASRSPELGMSRSEVSQYSIARALSGAKASQGGEIGGFEGVIHDELLKRRGRALGPNTVLLPVDVFRHHCRNQTRADVVGTLGSGGYLVETDNAGFIELARPRSVTLSLGATPLEGLVGNVAFPRMTASVSYNWLLAETSGPSDQTHGLGQITLTPKEAAANIKVSRLLMMQSSPSSSAVLASDLLAGIGQAIDVAALGGSGVGGLPLGIANTPGIGSVSGTTLSNAGVIDLQGAVGNRLSAAGGYAAPIATAKLLSKRFRDTTNTSAYVWEGGLYGGLVAGNRAIASDDVPTGTLLYGSWDQCLVAGWGTLEVEVSPVGSASTDFQQNLIALRVIHALDIGVRDPKAFAAATSVT